MFAPQMENVTLAESTRPRNLYPVSRRHPINWRAQKECEEVLKKPEPDDGKLVSSY